MNLKEAFRFQNKLQSLMYEADNILSSPSNITKVETTLLRRKVMPEAEDETSFDLPTSEYSEQITEVAVEGLADPVQLLQAYPVCHLVVQISDRCLPDPGHVR